MKPDNKWFKSQYWHAKSSTQQEDSSHQQIGLTFKAEISTTTTPYTALYGAQTWTILKVAQKYLGSFEMLCWRRMERISWTYCMKSEELHTDEEERNIIYTMKQGKDNYICYFFHRSCLLKHDIKGELKVIGRRERRSKHLLDDLKEMRQYWKLKQEALDQTVWRTHFIRGYWPVISHTAWWWCKIDAN